SPASRLLRRWRDGAGGLRESLLEIRAGDAPGSRYAYCTPDSLALDWARERATGEAFPAALARLWSALEAERPAVVGLDGPAGHGGVAMAGGSLAATARDWARIGTLQIDGRWRNRQVVSCSWVQASSRPEREFLAPGRLPSTITSHAGFGYHWWPLDPAGEHVMADGMARAARARAAGMSWSPGTTWLTSPRSPASAAVIVRPVSSSSTATGRGSRRGSQSTPPESGMMPSPVSGRLNSACSAATTR